MRAGRRSQTAEAAAFLRAAHLVLDDPPPLFIDRRVMPLLAAPARLWLRGPARLARQRWLPAGPAAMALSQLRGQTVLRARYCEDRLESRLDCGIEQYVVLSAGLDTFALRRADLAGRLQVIEVDQADTQRWKRRRLDVAVPSNLHFVEIDFERQSIADALRASPFAPEHASFFSWLGTTYYLSRVAIRATLESILSVAVRGSELVLDYWSSEPDLGWPAQTLLSGVRFAAALQSEPMLSFFRPEEIEREVAALGYQVVEHLGPKAQRERYLQGRSDALDVPDFAHLLCLRVP